MQLAAILGIETDVWGIVVGIAIGLAVPLGIERYKRPRIEVRPHRAPREDRLDAAFVHVKIVNKPAKLLGWLLVRETATSAVVHATFKSKVNATQPVENLELRWDTQLEPDQDPRETLGRSRWDVVPTGSGETLPVAVKFQAGPECFAFSNRSYFMLSIGVAPNWKESAQRPEMRLPDTEYEVEIAYESAGVKRTKIFTLRNYGTDLNDFELRGS